MEKQFKSMSEEFRYYVMEKLSGGKECSVRELEDYVYSNSTLERENPTKYSHVFYQLAEDLSSGVIKKRRGVYQLVGKTSILEVTGDKLEKEVTEVDNYVKKTFIGLDEFDEDVINEFGKTKQMIGEIKEILEKY